MKADGKTTPEVCVVADSAGNAKCALRVRLKATRQVGDVEGSITIASKLMETQIIPLGGVVQGLTLKPSSLPVFKADIGQPSDFQEITVPAASASKVEVASPQNSFEMRLKGTSAFASKITLPGNQPSTVQVRMKPKPLFGPFSEKLSITVFFSGGGSFSQSYPVFGSVTLTTVNPASLAGFTAEEGKVSAPQGFAVEVRGLAIPNPALVSVAAPKGYLVGLSRNVPASFVQALILIPQNGKLTDSVFVKLSSSNVAGTVKGDVLISGNDIVSKKVAVSGTVTSKPQPSLSVDKTSLAFSTTTNKASSTQSYLLKASSLAANTAATVSAPAGYEVSNSNTTGSAFSSKLSLTAFNGGINATVFVRLKSTSIAGTVNGTLTNTVAGFSKSVSLTGTVNPAPSLTLSATGLSGFSTAVNQASASKTYTFQALNLAAGVTATVTAPTNYELRIQNTGIFVGSLTLSQTSTGTIDRTIEVRIKATAPSGTVTGSIAHSVAALSKALSLTGTVQGASVATARMGEPTLGEAPLSRHLTAFPNPFSEKVTVRFTAQHTGKVQLHLFDGQGQLVQPLFEEEMQAGQVQQMDVPAGNLKGGLYLLRLVSGPHTGYQKLVLQR